MKTVNNLQSGWQFAVGTDFETIPASEWQSINLPHTVKEVPVHYFDEKVCQMQSCYTRKFILDTLPARSFLQFEGVMTYCRVFLNSKYIGEHKGGYTAFVLEITGSVSPGENILRVDVDSTERTDIPPFGNTIDYLTYGGIYRDVFLIASDSACITHLQTDATDCLSEMAVLSVTAQIDSLYAENGALSLVLSDESGEKTASVPVRIQPGVNTVHLAMRDLRDTVLWDCENPHLYDLTARYTSDSSVSVRECRVGFRKALFTPNGFVLNGKKMKLFGLNRHQDFPVIGYAAPKRLQQRDADILKNELSLNLVRTSHYPQSAYFLDRCDEIGLLVFEEIPGWQHIGDVQWKEVAQQNVSEMIRHDCNHPSIVLWGVRINESGDCDDFYRITNLVAHSLDPSRQTGGVRCCKNSNLLEDVYTYNDFQYSSRGNPHENQQEVTGFDRDVPYLITEYCGHMYPTKQYDQEERVIEHAMRFVRMVNAANVDGTVCGAIGWCAFDYHTHANFGSGDHVCYHGVMDMFRLPKMAAYFFKSQKSPQIKPVLEPATRWTVGERNGCGITPLVLFTNCDYITVTVGGKSIGTYYPNHQQFPGLIHPPIIVQDFNVVWGGMWGDGVFAGYVGGTLVIRRELAANPLPATLEIKPDDIEIFADGSDMTRVIIRLSDQKGNVLPFAFDPVKIEVSGAAVLVGASTVSLYGGVYAFWVRSNGQTGAIYVTAQTDAVETASCCIAAKPCEGCI